MADASKEIGELEARIERLGLEAERAQDLMKYGQTGIGLGVALFVLTLSGLFALPSATILLALALLLAGIIFFGSNKSTRDEFLAALEECQTQRSAIIDSLDLGSTERGVIELFPTRH